jgi:dihydroflavonol-4-reductase
MRARALKIVVLGGTGFVGNHVVRELVAQGHDVRCVVRPASSARASLDGLDVEVVPGDLLEPISLLAAFRGQDAVIHAAGSLSLWDGQKDELWRTNVLGTRHVVEACLAARVDRLIWDGSVGIYAGSTSPTPVDEAGAPSADRFHSFHVTSMCLAETEVWRGAAKGLHVVALHPGLCLGVGDRRMHSSWAIIGLAFSRLPFCPPGGLALVDVLDVARAHTLALERAPRGGNYLLGGENLTNRAFVDLLRDVLGISVPAIPLPRAGMRLLGDLGELVAKATGTDRGHRVTLNHAIGTAMSLYWFVDDRSARQELGYGPSPIRPALERQIDWLREQGLLPESGFGARAFVDRFFRLEPGA